ncbi:MAG: hypothetical protein JXB26_09740 [Candidatus Aminicenantes bacterium]|nr:hypothetical protein [Candidatus Aminicenantes bacterium]
MHIACAPPKKTILSSMAKNSLETRLTDLEYTAREIKNGYINLAFKEKMFGFSWEQLVPLYRKRILQVKTEGEFYGLMRELLSRLHDGHTAFQLISKSLQKKMFDGWENLSNLPDLRWIENRPVIVRALKKWDCLGWEVVSINGISFEKIIETTVPRFCSSNDKTTRDWILERHQYLYYFPFMGKSIGYLKMAVFNPRTDDRKILTICPAGEASSEKESIKGMPFGFPEKRKNIRSDIIDCDIGYIRIPEFTLPPDTFRKKIKSILNDFQQKKVRAVILDLRYNRGGNNSFLYFLRQLVREKILINYYRYRISDRFLEKRRDVLLHQKKVRKSLDEEPESGYSHWFSWTVSPLKENILSNVPVAVLCNPGCFSSTDVFITACLEHKLALVVGNGYGGSGFGYPMRIRLPSQKYEVVYSVWEERDTQRRHKENIVRKMDVPVEQTLEDLYYGRDSQLQAAVEALLLRLKDTV